MRGLYRSDDGRDVKSTVFLTDLEKQKEFLVYIFCVYIFLFSSIYVYRYLRDTERIVMNLNSIFFKL